MAGKRNYYEDKIGKKFGRLTFLGMSNDLYKYDRYLGNFMCDCGNFYQTVPRSVFFKNSKGRSTVSCGCWSDENKRNKDLIRKKKRTLWGTKRVDSGEMSNIIYRPKDNVWEVRMARNGQRVHVRFSSLEDAQKCRDFTKELLKLQLKDTQ